jgi:hypothetical protein
MLRHSLRNLPLKLSSATFCHGLPGSIRAVSILAYANYAKIALLANSGPLSKRRNVGTPCSLTKRLSTSMTRGERILPATSMATLSHVNSSITVEALELLPVGADIVNEVVGPHLVRAYGRQWTRT